MLGYGKKLLITKKEAEKLLKELELPKKRGRPKKNITQAEINKITKITKGDVNKIAKNYDVKLDKLNDLNMNSGDIKYLDERLQLDNKNIYIIMVQINELINLYDMQLNAGYNNEMMLKNIFELINRAYSMANDDDLEKLKYVFMKRLKN
jgi:hypothetical protein